MKIVGLLLTVAFMGNFLSCSNGCSSKVSMQNEKTLTKNMNDLEKFSGLKLPASAKVLSATDESGHDGTKYRRWIVASAERPMLSGATIDGDDNKTFLKTLKEAMPDEDFGNPVGDKYQFSDWSNEQGGWQAATIETDKGFYLSLENIALD